MKTREFLIAMAFVTGLFFASCEDEDEKAKPEITKIEFGSSHDTGNDHSAYQGGDLHIEAEIYAEAKVDYIIVEIHPEGEEGEEHEGEEWNFDSTYTLGFNGAINPTFHKHIEISETADTGDYHFHFIVVDMKGNQVTTEDELEILEAISNIAVSHLSVNGGKHDVSKASGSFTISFEASVEIGTLASYHIEVHSEPESGDEADEFKLLDEEFKDSFNGLTNASVDKEITIDADAPLGKYHVEIVIIDSEVNEKIVSAHIDLED